MQPHVFMGRMFCIGMVFSSYSAIVVRMTAGDCLKWSGCDAHCALPGRDLEEGTLFQPAM